MAKNIRSNKGIRRSQKHVENGDVNSIKRHTIRPHDAAYKQEQKHGRNSWIKRYMVAALISTGLILFYLVYSTYLQPQVALNDTVEIWYTERLESGKVSDTNVEEIGIGSNITKDFKPFSFVVGEGKVIPGIENAVIGMKAGEKKTVRVSPEDAYGNYKAGLVRTVSMEEFTEMFPTVTTVEIGKKLHFKLPNGYYGSMTIKNQGVNFVTLDFNHDLAGQTLIFDIEVISIIE